MNEAKRHRIAELIERRLDRSLNDEQFAELQAALLDGPVARELFLDLSHQHASLQMLEESLVKEQLKVRVIRPMAWRRIGVAAAAVLVAGFLSWSIFSGPRQVATLVSSENAAWEGSLPTTPGAKLSAGFLKLKTGVATIRFESGAEVILEAPAHLVLKTPMRGKLLAGAAVIDVPEPAIGFVMETPDGYAVDHGTQFAVSVDEQSRKSEFEVLSGEISVHHPPSGTEVRLNEQEATSVTATGLEALDGPLPEGTLARNSAGLRLGTKGQATSVIRSDDRDYLHPDLLMVKLTKKLTQYDRRALFCFDLAKVDWETANSAAIRLNLVPSGLGYAARLEEMNRFAIYGLPQNLDLDGNGEITWESAPQPEDGELLGTFEIPRSRQRGSFGIATDALLNFLRANASRRVTFVLVRETMEREGSGLVHAFASDLHPEASGPVLEISPYNQP